MKKITAILCIVMCCALLFGCNSEDKKYDQEFLKDLKQGMMDRWDMSGVIYLDSKANGEKLVNAELQQIEKYLTKNFEDSELQEKAIGYINLLKKQKEALKYYDVDYDKYDKLWSEALASRSTYILDFINSYGLEFPDKYKETIDDFKVRAKIVEDDKTLTKQIDELKKSIEFEKVEQEYEWAYYEAVVENTTEKTFDYFSIEINLMDADGVIIESTYATVDNWRPGKKAKFEFMTDAEFESYEYEVDYYINE